jgi:hypothetical protein
MTLRLAALAAVPVALASSAACSWSFCNDGILPFDGRTGVALDTVVTISLFGRLPVDAPSLQETISFVDLTTGEPVAFDAQLDPDADVVTVTPRALLEAGHDYEVRGVQRPQRGNAHHFDNTAFFWASGVYGGVTTFSTGSEPVVLATSLTDDNVLLMQFSEPVDAPALVEAMRFYVDTSEGEEVVEAVPVGVQDGRGFVFGWMLTEDVDPMSLQYEAEWLPVREGEGGPVPSTHVAFTWVDEPYLRRRASGLSTCGGL